MPGGAPYHPAGFMTFVGASRHGERQDSGRLPGGQGSAEFAVYEGALVDFDTALKIEARWFTNPC